MSSVDAPTRTDPTAATTEAYAAALGRYVSGELDLAEAAERAGVSRWAFVERLRDDGVESPGPSSELA